MKKRNTASKREVILSQSGPVNYENIEVWCGQCPRYHTEVNSNWTRGQLQVILSGHMYMDRRMNSILTTKQGASSK